VFISPTKHLKPLNRLNYYITQSDNYSQAHAVCT